MINADRIFTFECYARYQSRTAGKMQIFLKKIYENKELNSGTLWTIKLARVRILAENKIAFVSIVADRLKENYIVGESNYRIKSGETNKVALQERGKAIQNFAIQTSRAKLIIASYMEL